MSLSRLRSRAGRCVAAVGLVACVLLGACAPKHSSGAVSRPSSATPSAQHDWRNATYSLTCDGVVPDEFRAKLVNGVARVSADVSQTPYFDYFDVRAEARVTGDLDGDRKSDTVVLLQCSPQPSNGFVEEVQVFGADGSRLGVLPSPRMLPEATILAPLYVPAGLSVEHENIVAAMKAYGPEDSHATGPSVPITVHWHWDGTRFVRVP